MAPFAYSGLQTFKFHMLTPKVHANIVLCIM